MKAILKNRFFISAVVLVLLQQIFVAGSSFAIAAAGEAVGRGDFKIVPQVILFFSLIALAYIVGATAQWLTVILANTVWKDYYQNLIADISKDSSLSSEKNKSLTNTWISGEALSTFETSSAFLVDVISIYLNIGFTIFTFYSILGVRITSAIAFGLVVSIAIIHFARRHIENLASSIQEGKVQALVAVQNLWDHAFFGNHNTFGGANERSSQLVGGFMKASSKYKALEQVISCTPVLISLPIVTLVAAADISAEKVAIGALVALLPRTLQLFQNLHAALSYASQFLLIRSKLKNLDDFAARLDRHELAAHVSAEKLKIIDENGRSVAVDSLLAGAVSPSGRLTIGGPNGCGKSTLLKLIKSQWPEAAMTGPQIQIVETSAGSTGQKLIQSIRELIRQQTPILLLDEWDANLDTANTAALDQQLNEYAKSFLVIEVRH